MDNEIKLLSRNDLNVKYLMTHSSNYKVSRNAMIQEYRKYRSKMSGLFASSPPVVDPNSAAVTQVWKYIGELVFNMLVLVGTIKMSDREVREMMGL